MSATSSHAPAHPAEPKLRHEFVGMMFAVAIGEVGLQAAALVRAGHWAHFLPAWSHLVLATVVIATSWVGWTLSVSPGARQDVSSVFQWEFLVLLLDVILVILYFIFVKSVDFTAEGAALRPASAVPEARWILVIFWCFLLWDILTKIFIVLKQKPTLGAWLKEYGVRMVPTLACLVLAWIIKRLVETADPPHVLTADLAFLALFLLFRALKDLISVSFPAPSGAGGSKGWAWFCTILCGVGIVVGIAWTRCWPVPRCIAAPIINSAIAGGGRASADLPCRSVAFSFKSSPSHRLAKARGQ